MRKYQRASNVEKMSKSFQYYENIEGGPNVEKISKEFKYWENIKVGPNIEKISKSFQYGENVEELLILRKNFKGSEY